MSDFCVGNYAAIFKMQEIMKKSYEDFGKKESLSYEEYGNLRGMDSTEASSYDLNENLQIDLFEDTVASYSKEDLNNPKPAIMVIRLIAGYLKLPEMQKAFLATQTEKSNPSSNIDTTV